MKNLLSENMLRFGTKNLSESAQRELTVKSIIETINEHGLHNEVRRHLIEGSTTTIETILTNANDGEPITDLFMLGKTYTTNNSYAAYSPAMADKDSIILFPKGTTWTVTSDGKLMIAPCVIVNKTQIEPKVGMDVMDRLNNGEFIAKLAAGQIKSIDGGMVKGVKTTAGICLHLRNTVATSNGKASIIKYPSYANNFLDKIQSFRAKQ